MSSIKYNFAVGTSIIGIGLDDDGMFDFCVILKTTRGYYRTFDTNTFEIAFRHKDVIEKYYVQK